MYITKRKAALVLAMASSFLFSGCASLKDELEGKNPPDTAILINNIPYQISTVNCAQIKAIGEHGALECYDSAGHQTAVVTPVSDWRRNYVKEKMGMDWASPEHQAFLFYMFHGGGNQKAMGALMTAAQQTYGTYQATKTMSDSMSKSKEINKQSAQMSTNGASAWMKGMPAWQAHQTSVIQWRLDNSSYFREQANKANVIGLE